jgi:hypothetical protein
MAVFWLHNTCFEQICHSIDHRYITELGLEVRLTPNLPTPNKGIRPSWNISSYYFVASGEARAGSRCRLPHFSVACVPGNLSCKLSASEQVCLAVTSKREHGMCLVRTSTGLPKVSVFQILSRANFETVLRNTPRPLLTQHDWLAVRMNRGPLLTLATPAGKFPENTHRDRGQGHNQSLINLHSSYSVVRNWRAYQPQGSCICRSGHIASEGSLSCAAGIWGGSWGPNSNPTFC